MDKKEFTTEELLRLRKDALEKAMRIKDAGTIRSGDMGASTWDEIREVANKIEDWMTRPA